MKYKVTKGIDRLELHDSSFMEFIRGKDYIFTFDWAKLSNFNEEGISEVIIMGKTKVTFKGVSNEEFSYYDDETNSFIASSFPENYIMNQPPIAQNKISEVERTFQIETLLEVKDQWLLRWTKWRINYSDATIEWDNHITHSDRKNGATLID